MINVTENNKNMRAIKSVVFNYQPNTQILDLLNTFRQMVNEAIHICISENIKGRLNLRNRIYHDFNEKYGLVTCYNYSVAEVAWSIVKKHKRWHRKPFAKHLMLKMDSYNYTLNISLLSIPYKKGERILIPLQYGDYQRSFLMDKTIKRGSITITARNIMISFSKEAGTIEPLRKVGYDINEKSLVSSDGIRYDLSEVSRIRNEYGYRRKKFYEKHSYDTRLKKKSSQNSREKNRIKQFLNRVSKDVVQKAKESKSLIVMEKLTHIRNSMKKGNGKGKKLRGRINRWSFHILQQQIVYKANWEGVPVEFVNPKNTSKTCSVCGQVNKKLKAEKEWQCPCGVIHNRDLNASRNVVARSNQVCMAVVQPQAVGR